MNVKKNAHSFITSHNTQQLEMLEKITRVKTLQNTTLCLKKVNLLMFDSNFGKFRPIFKILSPGDSQENSLCTHQKFSSHMQYVATLPCEIRKSKNVTKFSC